MTTTTPKHDTSRGPQRITAYDHKAHRTTCKLCADTGVVTSEEPAPIGRASNGEIVFSSRTKVYRFACICRQGWGRKVS